MIKPKHWTDLPYDLRDHLIESIDELDYDSYESSRAEAIEALHNDPDWGSDTQRNNERIQAVYESRSDEYLREEAERCIGYLQSRLDRLKNFVAGVPEE